MLRSSRYIVALMVVAIAAAVAPIGGSDASADVGALFKTGDSNTEKHIPVIECPVEFKVGEPTTVTVTVGKEVPHPNSTGHHFIPADSTLPYEVGSFEFGTHGGSVLGPDSSTLYVDPKITIDFRTGVPGVFYATAYCNIHGLWESAKAITVVE